MTLPPTHLTLTALAQSSGGFIDSVREWATQNPPQLVGAAVVVGLFLLLGFKDIARLNGRRIGALSGLVWRECVRRRVLWVTPLAIVGVIVISQLQKPSDEQDAIRQTIKYCLFASGLLVTLTVIILACTSLPKEIETRVIYTIVTKPPTRLEIVLGKVVGFARVSGAILLIMGLFTGGYLALRSSRLQSELTARLEQLSPTDPLRGTLEHYRDRGLLHAKTYAAPRDLQVYSRLPQPGDNRRWMFGEGDGDALVPFDLPPELFPADMDAAEAEKLFRTNVLVVLPNIDAVPHPMSDRGWERVGQAGPSGSAMPPAPLPTPQIRQPAGPLAPFPLSLNLTAPYASVRISVLNQDRYSVMPEAPKAEAGEKQAKPPPAILNAEFRVPRDPRLNQGLSSILISPAILDSLRAEPTLKAAGTVTAAGDDATSDRADDTGTPGCRRLYVRVEGVTPGYEYGLGDEPIVLYSPFLQEKLNQGILHPVRLDPSLPPAIMRGRIGPHGQTIRGGDTRRFDVPVAVYTFNGANVVPGPSGVPFEMKVGVERSGTDAAVDAEDPTVLSIQVRDRDTGALSPQQEVRIESNRPSYFSAPAGSTGKGNFDLLVRCDSTGHFAGTRLGSLSLVASEHSFALNLLKGLLVLWLMSLLVAAISVLCSTFVSWPIAVVLTLVLLLGHWGVVQLGDSLKPGVGSSVTSDFFKGTGPGAARVIDRGVELLTSLLNAFSTILPDISAFSASESVERGVNVGAASVGDALGVGLGFGLPAVMLAYLLLWRKEVAP